MISIDETYIDLESEIKMMLLKSQKKYCNFNCDKCLHYDLWLDNSSLIKTDEISFEESFELNPLYFLEVISDYLENYKICDLLDTKVRYKQTVQQVPFQSNFLGISISYIECRRKNRLIK